LLFPVTWNGTSHLVLIWGRHVGENCAVHLTGEAPDQLAIRASPPINIINRASAPFICNRVIHDNLDST
ncbi:MAG: hypothetical protein ABSG34_19425, partial [Candidatus Sulfotelmatobacter sp.]